MTDLYRNDIFPERACDRCSKVYRGPAVYCSLALANIVATYFAGLNPNIRNEIIERFENTVRKLVPVVENQMGNPWRSPEH